MKICLVCSHGGHLTETLQLLEAFEGHDIFFVTYHSSRDEELMKIAKSYFIQNIGSSIWRMLKAIPRALGILLKERRHLPELACEVLYAPFVLKIGWVGRENGDFTPALVVPHYLVEQWRTVARVKQADYGMWRRSEFGLYVVCRQPDGGAQVSPEPHFLAVVNIFQHGGRGDR